MKTKGFTIIEMTLYTALCSLVMTSFMSLYYMHYSNLSEIRTVAEQELNALHEYVQKEAIK